MGCCVSCNEPRIKTIDETPERKNFDYLRPKGTITYTIDKNYNISLIELYFEGSFKSSVCLWPKSNKMRSNLLLLERTPPPSASIFFFFI